MNQTTNPLLVPGAVLELSPEAVARPARVVKAIRRHQCLSQKGLAEATATSIETIRHAEQRDGSSWATMIHLLQASGYELVIRMKRTKD